MKATFLQQSNPGATGVNWFHTPAQVAIIRMDGVEFTSPVPENWTEAEKFNRVAKEAAEKIGRDEG